MKKLLAVVCIAIVLMVNMAALAETNNIDPTTQWSFAELYFGDDIQTYGNNSQTTGNLGDSDVSLALIGGACVLLLGTGVFAAKKAHNASKN